MLCASLDVARCLLVKVRRDVKGEMGWDGIGWVWMFGKVDAGTDDHEHAGT